MTFKNKINNDLKESQINWKVSLLFMPISFITYIFHEFGHFIIGELSGNNMKMRLNYAIPQSGYFIEESHALWSAIGGPLFTIIQAFVFLLVVWKTKSIYAYSLVFFAVFSRLFTIIFGGLDLQDETRIAILLNTNSYLISAIILTILVLTLWKSNRVMKLNIKAVGYFTVLGVLSILIVIGVNRLFIIN